jgi:magnesium-transporting ATPase (P-type)
MAAIIRRLCCHRDAVAPTKDGDSAEAQPQLSDDAERDMSRSFKEHHMSVEDIGQLHSSSGINTADVQRSSGLTNKEAADRLVTFGRNSLPPPKELSNWRLLLKQFLNFFWLLLIGAGILSLITYALDTSVPMNLYVAFVLFAIVFIMCFIQFWEEKKARNV